MTSVLTSSSLLWSFPCLCPYYDSFVSKASLISPRLVRIHITLLQMPIQKWLSLKKSPGISGQSGGLGSHYMPSGRAWVPSEGARLGSPCRLVAVEKKRSQLVFWCLGWKRIFSDTGAEWENRLSEGEGPFFRTGANSRQSPEPLLRQASGQFT